MMGGLHPRGSLYERPVNIDSAKLQHARFREVLREHGVKVGAPPQKRGEGGGGGSACGV